MSSSLLMHALVMQKLYVQHMYSTELAIVHRTANSLLDMASPVLRNFHVASPTKDKMSLSKFLLLQNYKSIASAFPGQAYNVHSCYR